MVEILSLNGVPGFRFFGNRVQLSFGCRCIVIRQGSLP